MMKFDTDDDASAIELATMVTNVNNSSDDSLRANGDDLNGLLTTRPSICFKYRTKKESTLCLSTEAVICITVELSHWPTVPEMVV